MFAFTFAWEHSILLDRAQPRRHPFLRKWDSSPAHCDPLACPPTCWFTLHPPPAPVMCKRKLHPARWSSHPPTFLHPFACKRRRECAFTSAFARDHSTIYLDSFAQPPASLPHPLKSPTRMQMRTQTHDCAGTGTGIYPSWVRVRVWSLPPMGIPVVFPTCIP
ncbi:hypothetical protein F5I97DRAFT_1832670 [Phlebopus sp. FC_14]|nr:hypothetical protein F5I97DRAFT_1832670 [Phlebopus sp. FC_14]